MPERILWLDNDPNYIEPYVEVLREEKYDVDVVTTVAEAERLIQSGQYGLLILDVMIPTKGAEEEERYKPSETEKGNKTGLLFYTQNKSTLESNRTKVLVMTVRLDENIVHDFMRAGLLRANFTTKYEVRNVAVFMERIGTILPNTQG